MHIQNALLSHTRTTVHRAPAHIAPATRPATAIHMAGSAFIAATLGIAQTTSATAEVHVGTPPLVIEELSPQLHPDAAWRQLVRDELVHINPGSVDVAPTIADALIEAERLIALIDEHHQRARTYDRYDLLALARIESNVRPDARSSAGARGAMQLMPATYRARQPALQAFITTQPHLAIDPLTDDITDIRANILVGAYDLIEKRTAIERRTTDWLAHEHNQLGLIAYTMGVAGAHDREGKPAMTRSALRHAIYIPLLAEQYRAGAAAVDLAPVEIFSAWQAFQKSYNLPQLSPAAFIARMGLHVPVAQLNTSET